LDKLQYLILRKSQHSVFIFYEAAFKISRLDAVSKLIYLAVAALADEQQQRPLANGKGVHF
jgi:hypothetical protein